MNALALDLYVPPEPIHWEMEPHAKQSDAVEMAVTPLDSEGLVEYRFVCRSGNAPSSEWKKDSSYTVTGLKANTRYAFMARARRDGRLVGLPSQTISVKTHRTDKPERVAQIDAAIRNGEIERIPIMVNGDKDNRINMAFINRWWQGQRHPYNHPDMREEFVQDCQRGLDIFTAGHPDGIYPYPEYKNFFNLYGMWWPGMPPENKKDAKKGMQNDDYNDIRDRFFLPWNHPDHGWVTQIGFPNSGARGGGAGRIPEKRIGQAFIIGNAPRGIVHEFNHTAPGIPDEYTSSGMWGSGGEGSTITFDHRRDFNRWRAWIEPTTPVPTPYSAAYLDKIGLHEGGQHRMAYHYRPTARGCLMGAGSGGGPDMCPICRQQAVSRFYQWVNAIDKRSPDLNEITIPKPYRIAFSVERVHPVPDTQKTKWTLNGKVIAENTDHIEVDFANLDRYELTFSLVDESKYVRPDPPYTEYPHAETTWTILNPNANGSSEQMQATLSGIKPVFRGVDNGSITVEVSGGKSPYSFYWTDDYEGPNREGLSPGSYAVTIVDSDFRRLTRSIDLAPAQAFDARLVSHFDGDRWQIGCPAATNNQIEVEWSTGENTAIIRKIEDGEIRCTVLSDTGCRTTQTLQLKRPDSPLEISVHRLFASSGGENNGYVGLHVEGGREPMCYLWSDGVETSVPEHHYIHPGTHSVTVRDANGTEQVCPFTVLSEPAFEVSGIELAREDNHSVRVTNPDPNLVYFWFKKDLPAWLPRYPHGIYSGTYTSPAGKECEAEAYVIQEKGGFYLEKPTNKPAFHRNDFGHWVHVMIYENGRKEEPRILRLKVTESEAGLSISNHGKNTEGEWSGSLNEGTMAVTEADTGSLKLRYISRPNSIDQPFAIGTRCQIPEPGHYFIAARKKGNGAVSRNRLGVTFNQAPANKAAPIKPNAVQSADLLMWLDASDMNGDGRFDDNRESPLRRGAVMGWQGKANDIDFKGMVFYEPNSLNGLAVASWKTIWIQGLSKEPRGYQTIIMVRREHDLSSVGTAPWQKLSPLIGTGTYGEKLFSNEAAASLAESRIFVNSEQVDPNNAEMPVDFYIATYEFDKPIKDIFGKSEGLWEGDVAECLVFDRPLADRERRGLEEYLRRKWISAVDLSFKE